MLLMQIMKFKILNEFFYLSVTQKKVQLIKNWKVIVLLNWTSLLFFKDQVQRWWRWCFFLSPTCCFSPGCFDLNQWKFTFDLLLCGFSLSWNVCVWERERVKPGLLCLCCHSVKVRHLKTEVKKNCWSGTGAEGVKNMVFLLKFKTS